MHPSASLLCRRPLLTTQYIAKLASTSDYSKANEPGVLSYAVFLGREDDQKTVYMIEVYADEAAFNTHMQSDKVKDMIAWMGANPVLDGAPTVLELDVVEDFGFFSREAAADPAVADPFVVVAEVGYKDGSLVQQALPHWAKVVKTTKDDEPGSYVYTLALNPAEPTKLYSFEAYESKDYLWNVHVKSQAVQDNVAATKDWRNGLTHHLLRKHHGFLARSKI